jgi:hypothetical protein
MGNLPWAALRNLRIELQLKTENLQAESEICGCVARVTARRAFLSMFSARLSQCLNWNIGLKARRVLFCPRGTAGQFGKRGQR